MTLKKKGFCSVICLMIFYVFDICDCKCDEYVILFQEISCNKVYLLRPTKIPDIQWNTLTDPCNSTVLEEELHGNKDCILEFQCMGNQFDCTDRIIPINHASHSLIPGNKTIKFPKNGKRETMVNTGEKETKTPIPSVKEDKKLMYDVNVIYVNENDRQYNPEFSKKSKNQTDVIQCDFAETLCSNKNHVNENFTGHEESVKTLIVTFNRGENSTIQPIFTGYYPPIFNNSNITNNKLNKTMNSHFNYSKTVTLVCKLSEKQNCTQKIGNRSITDMNVYLKTNYIQNGTKTKYPNCTKNYNTQNDTIFVTCEALEFSKYNPVFSSTSHVNNTGISNETETKQEINIMKPEDLLRWHCHIKLNNTLTYIHNKEYNIVYLKNCSNYINLNYYKNEGLNGTLTGDNTDQIIENITTKDNIEVDRTKTANTEIKNTSRIRKEHFSNTSKENIITIHIIENKTNCIQNSSLNIREGKIIDLRTFHHKNNTKEVIESNNSELKLSNCINNGSSVMNDKNEETELVIVLKADSLNSSNLKLLNQLKHGFLKQRLILQCDHGKRNFNASIEKNTTVLKCTSIDLKDSDNIEESDDNIILTANEDDNKVQKDKIKMINENYNKTITNTEVNNNSHSTSNTTSAQNRSLESTTKSIIEEIPTQNTTEEIATENNIVEITTQMIPNENVFNDTNNKDSNRTKRLTFNKRADIAEGFGQESLGLADDNTEKILLIALSSIAGTCIVLIFALRCFKKKEYGPAPTREVPDEEDTAL